MERGRDSSAGEISGGPRNIIFGGAFEMACLTL